MQYELSLVCFTVLGQLAGGIALAVWLAGLDRFPDVERRAWMLALGAGIVGMVGAASHLSSLGSAFYSLSGLGASWLSREIAAGAIFGAVVLLRFLGVLKAPMNWLVAVLGVAFVLVMAQIYGQNNVSPLWNNAGASLSFLAAMCLLGGAAAPALAGAKADDRIGRVSALGLLVGATASAVLPVFWVKGVLTGLDPAALGVFSTAVICMSLTQMAGIILGGACLVWGFPRKSALFWPGFALILAATVVGRMLFYASNIKVGF